ncbi:MAG: cytochrome c oxidase subunit II [Bacteroidales bacterium]|nr:MAG: cytochrome c oxidase subunit II [Bacteroidales bacterium]
MFEGASNFAKGVDGAFLFILAISFFFLIGLSAVMIWFMIRYNRKKHPKAEQIKDNMKLEVAWTIIPFLIVMLMFYYGYVVFKPMRIVPKDAMEVNVTGMMWSWKFEYANGKITNELVLPVGKAVKLNLFSPDVIHSLYIPAFRIKEDLVPGKENYMWFIPNIEGSYEILCAEYCGLRHSFMEAKTRIVTDEEFQKWLAEPTPIAEEDKGLAILQNNACISCHSLDGSKLVGPTFKGLFGTERTVIEAGKERIVVADSAYIKRAILEPDKEIVKGYNPGMMRAYDKVITADDIKSIIAYFESQSKLPK